MTQKEQLLEFLKAHCVEYGDFTLSSGQKSDTYIDLRRATLSFDAMDQVGAVLFEVVREMGAYGVAGEGLGAYSLVCATVLEAKKQGHRLEGCFIRKEPKAHGKGQQLEGVAAWPAGASVVVLEDTTTTGGALVKACRVLQTAQFEVRGVVALVNRGGKEVVEKFSDYAQGFRSVYNVGELIDKGRL